MPAPIDAAVAAFSTEDAGVLQGPDDRKRVADPFAAPWRHICALRITSGTFAPFVGTGWLVSPRVVITAGHCLYLHNYGGLARSVEIIPALTDEYAPYKSAVSDRFAVLPRWIEARDPGFDVGAIFLAGDGFAAAGSFSFGVPSADLLRGRPIHIAGYPADLDDATQLYHHALKMPDQDPLLAERILQYGNDTTPGQSGAPIFLSLEDSLVVVGIHTNGYPGRPNRGLGIMGDIFRQILRWKREL